MGEPHHVIVLPGILGHTPGLDRIRAAVVKEMPETSAQVWDWTKVEPHWFPNPIGHVREYGRNRARAKLLAEQIMRFKRDHPDVRLSIVALSGGTAIALFACEELSAGAAASPQEAGPGKPLERIVLLSSGVSPGYDLRPALKQVESGIVNYWSRRDWLVLKRGTSLFGSLDRYYGPAAGQCGFDEAATCGGRCDGLTQIEWHRGMKGLGNRGGHAGSMARPFLRECVVQWLGGNLDACAVSVEP